MKVRIPLTATIKGLYEQSHNYNISKAPAIKKRPKSSCTSSISVIRDLAQLFTTYAHSLILKLQLATNTKRGLEGNIKVSLG